MLVEKYIFIDNTNIMNEKFKRLSKKIVELLSNTETPQDTYNSLIILMEKQQDYFQYISADNILKLTFYCYSFAQTNDFKLADKLINEISFAVIFYHSGDHHLILCPECGGDGEVKCAYCGGSNKVECTNCSGFGRVTCDECDGNGEIGDDDHIEVCDECDGNGVLKCNDCKGTGEVTCNNCDYNGTNICAECDGIGEVETEDLLYNRYFIVTWNKYIKERCELNENTNQIAISEYDFDRLQDEYITLKNTENKAPFADWVEQNELYCTYYNDNPNMYLTKKMDLDTSEDNIYKYL